jgi:hypothetical protein
MINILGEANNTDCIKLKHDNDVLKEKNTALNNELVAISDSVLMIRIQNLKSNNTVLRHTIKSLTADYKYERDRNKTLSAERDKHIKNIISLKAELSNCNAGLYAA